MTEREASIEQLKSNIKHFRKCRACSKFLKGEEAALDKLEAEAKQPVPLGNDRCKSCWEADVDASGFIRAWIHKPNQPCPCPCHQQPAPAAPKSSAEVDVVAVLLMVQECKAKTNGNGLCKTCKRNVGSAIAKLTQEKET